MSAKKKIIITVMVLLLALGTFFPFVVTVLGSADVSPKMIWPETEEIPLPETETVTWPETDDVALSETDDVALSETEKVSPPAVDTEAAARRGDPALHYSNPGAGMKIALTFDDGPHAKYTPEILDYLAERGVRATFFVVGENAARFPALVQREIDEGHEIGNHTFSHAHLSKISYREQCDEVIAAENAVYEENEYRTRLLRPPGGLYSESIFKLADRLDYTVILWSVDTRDWAHTPADKIAENVLSTVKGGDVILFHDFIGKSSPTLDALKKVIPALQSRGFEFVTVSELFGLG